MILAVIIEKQGSNPRPRRARQVQIPVEEGDAAEALDAAPEAEQDGMATLKSNLASGMRIFYCSWGLEL